MTVKLRIKSLVEKIGLACIVLLPNHDLINFLVAGTPLVIWKQGILGIFAALAMFVLNERGRTPELRASRNVANAILLASVPPFLFATIGSDISIVALSYGYFFYLGGIGAILFGAQLKTLGCFDRVLTFAVKVGIFSAFLVIIDYFTDVFSFLPRDSLGTEEVMFSEHLQRAAGLFGASTLVAPFLLFSITAGLLLFMRRKRTSDALTLMVSVVLGLSAIFLSGSRAGMLTSMFLVTVQLLLALWYVRFRHAWVFVLGFVVAGFVVMGPSLMGEFALQLERLSDRYRFALASDAVGNDLRYQVWQICMDRVSEISVYSVFGYGFGATSGTFGKALVPHCESSFFQSILEAGPIGLAIRYGPGVLAFVATLLRIFGRGSRYEFFEAMVLLGWLLGYFALISTSPTAGAFHNQFIYMMVSGLLLSAPGWRTQAADRFSVELRHTYAQG